MRRFVLSIIIILSGFSYSCYQKDITPSSQIDQRRPVPQRPDQQRLKVESGAVKDDTNVHYNGNYCMGCHEQTPRDIPTYLLSLNKRR